MRLDGNKLAGVWKIKFVGVSGNIFTSQKYIVLQRLSVRSNRLQRLEFEGELPLLQDMDLAYNVLSELVGLGSLRCLCRLDLSHNRLSQLTGEIGSLQMLQDLDVSNNAISQYLPSPMES